MPTALSLAFLNPGDGQRPHVNPLMQKFLAVDSMRALYRKIKLPAERSIMENLLEVMDVRYTVADCDMARIPASGPVIVIANHPFGLIEGAILGTMLARIRPDVKIMTNYLLEEISELRDRCIFVDPFQQKSSAALNRRALKQAVAWLKHGGMLAVFPAGEVSHWSFRNGEIADPKWSETIPRLIHITGAAALPLFFNGANGVPFQLIGMLHPRLRTLCLPQELLNKVGKTVEVRVGTPIPAKTVCAVDNLTAATSYLRWRTYLLANRREAIKDRRRKLAVAVAGPQSQFDMCAEISALPEAQLLDASEGFSVYIASSSQIPILMLELGRLREMTFREAVEGTGRALDLDAFDPYYQHLLLWNHRKNELAGAYRIGDTQTILARFGIKGLYTSTLFHYHPRFFEKIGPALELGRSFVRPEYQKKYAPLFLLWKGLTAYIGRNPDRPIVFGAVSISNEYNWASRQLVVNYFQGGQDRQLTQLAKLRRPFKSGAIREWDRLELRHVLPDLDALSAPIADMETDGKGIPILLKQYVKMGGKLLAFNVDNQFSDTLDGLVMVDVRETDPVLLARYMTKEGVRAFHDYHRIISRIA